MIRHIIDQPFVAATALAAFWHSTVVLATIFSGTMPTDLPGQILWILPAALIAFALDIGQVATAAEIKAGSRTLSKFATFFIFAVATWYLQFLYLVLHIPTLDLGNGVAPEHKVLVTTLLNASIYIIPLLLPLSTLLYSFSHRLVPMTEQETIDTAVGLIVSTPVGKPLPAPKKDALSKYVTPNEDGTYTVTSPTGRVLRTDYPTASRAEGALRLHLRALSKKPALEPINGPKVKNPSDRGSSDNHHQSEGVRSTEV